MGNAINEISLHCVEGAYGTSSSDHKKKWRGFEIKAGGQMMHYERVLAPIMRVMGSYKWSGLVLCIICEEQSVWNIYCQCGMWTM